MSRRIAYLKNNVSDKEYDFSSMQDTFKIIPFENERVFLKWIANGQKADMLIIAGELRNPKELALVQYLKTMLSFQMPIIYVVSKIDPEIKNTALSLRIAELMEYTDQHELAAKRIHFILDFYENHATQEAFPVRKYKMPVIKRVFDILFAGTLLLLLSPMFLLIIILIKLESRGPAFYISKRAGAQYRIFDFYKFRSMRTDADANLKALKHLNQYRKADPGAAPVEVCQDCMESNSSCTAKLILDNKTVCEKIYLASKKLNGDTFVKIADDPRVTKIGKFIRNNSIDELPQLFNVLKGDMSIVGNRPLPLYEAEKITTDKYSLRFFAPAGITGLWQVNKRGKKEMSEDERIELDNDYARNYSFARDIKIILKTIPALLQKENV